MPGQSRILIIDDEQVIRDGCERALQRECYSIVKAIDGDPDRFEAVVTLSLDTKWVLPDDTDARVSTDGLLGGAYIALEPGGGMDTLPQDGKGVIQYTRGSVDLLTLFASFAAGGGGSDTPEEPAADPLVDELEGVEP